MNLAPYSPPRATLTGTGLPPPFNKKTKWPSWKDDVFITEMYNAQHRCGVYTEMAQSSKYSWKLPALWDLIAATVEQKCRSMYQCYTDVVDENTLKTSADQVRGRARLYKTNARLIEVKAIFVNAHYSVRS
ncbi:hypothetical protein RND81_13G165200 [Saponaria officinalis]|uniref:Uncharacterized protein n=1 Tax=Saponaria officinalis TaxID=3572 RepID=A0AAW1H276_SAPOF